MEPDPVFGPSGIVKKHEKNRSFFGGQKMVKKVMFFGPQRHVEKRDL